MDASGLSNLDLAEISMEAAQEELEVQQCICRELETAIQAVQDFCEDTEHRQAILYELTEYQEQAGNLLDMLGRKLIAAEQCYSEAQRATQA